jgi:HSP20 family protein
MASLARRQRDPDQLYRLDPFRTFRDLLRWDPFSEMDVAPRAGESMFIPDVELKETPEQIVLEVDLPGMRQEDIDVSLIGNRLTISGRREERRRTENEQYFAYERQYGTFSRTFALPETCDPEQVKAEMRDGVLTITIPKRPGAQARHVPVMSSGQPQGEGRTLSAGQGQTSGQAQSSGQAQTSGQGRAASSGQVPVQGERSEGSKGSRTS